MKNRINKLTDFLKHNELTGKFQNAFNSLLDELELGVEDETIDETGSETILMRPDHNNTIFWNEEGKCIGGYDKYEVTGLEEWYYQWEDEIFYHSNHWNNAQWKDWWNNGLQLAKEVRKQLPKNVRLYYFSLNDRVWIIRPEDTIGGGLFDFGEPVRID